MLFIFRICAHIYIEMNFLHWWTWIITTKSSCSESSHIVNYLSLRFGFIGTRFSRPIKMTSYNNIKCSQLFSNQTNFAFQTQFEIDQQISSNCFNPVNFLYKKFILNRPFVRPFDISVVKNLYSRRWNSFYDFWLCAIWWDFFFIH